MGFANTSSNFLDATTTDGLIQDASLRVITHRFTFELQPSRNLSIGFVLGLDKLSLGDPHSQLNTSNGGLGDQRIWGEFRFIDTVGASLGLAIQSKFPAYKNPTSQDLQNAGSGSIALLGDAETDFSLLLTSEYWLNTNWRSRFDFGLTYRTEGYAGEAPYMLSVGYASQKIDFDLRFKGNFSLGNDRLATLEQNPQGVSELRQAFAGSTYALAENPWILAINPKLEIWTSNKFALNFEYQYSLIGKNAPHYHQITVGMCMRWASNRIHRPKTFKQVDMSTVQDPEKFQGEMSEEEKLPKIREDNPGFEEPRGDEEFP